MKIFFKAILVHTILNVYVFYKGWQVIPDKKVYKIPFVTLFIIDILVYLIGFIFTEHLPFDVLRYIMIIGTTWAVFVLYVAVFLLLFDLGRLIYRKICKIVNKKINGLNTRRIRQVSYFTIVIFVVAVMSIGYCHFRHPVVSEKDVVVEKKAHNIKRMKIVMASDLHIGYMNDRKILKAYVDKIMEQNPDIILLVGDIIDYSLKPLVEQHDEEELRRLDAPYGVYMSLGNHEHYADEEDKIRWLREKSGMTILQDSVILVDSAFYLVGREDRKSPRKPLEKLLAGTDKNLPVIVMNHQPDNLDEEVDNGVDLAFYGHTHNGQIFPINKVLGFMYELSAGYKKKKDTHIFVSSGLGIGGPQYRIGTDSEIIVVNLSFVSSEN